MKIRVCPCLRLLYILWFFFLWKRRRSHEKPINYSWICICYESQLVAHTHKSLDLRSITNWLTFYYFLFYEIPRVHIHTAGVNFYLIHSLFPGQFNRNFRSQKKNVWKYEIAVVRHYRYISLYGRWPSIAKQLISNHRPKKAKITNPINMQTHLSTHNNNNNNNTRIWK